MGNAFSLGKLFGIQFRLHYTWFVIFVLVVVMLSWQYFPAFYPGWTRLIYWVIGIATGLLFFASVVAHELAHSVVAKAYGIPVKSITLFIFGGAAQIAREAARAGDELKMAAAGPACSLAIGGLFFLIQMLLSGINEPIVAMAYCLAQVNVVLAVFNLIPGFPLDGGRVFRSILWRATGNYMRSTRIATRVGQGVGYSFILGGILVALSDTFGLDWFGGLYWFSGLWLVFIGWFLANAASFSYRQVQQREALHGFTASTVMTYDWLVVPADITVGRLVQGYVFSIGRRFFLVGGEDNLEGIVTLGNIKSVSRQNWDVTQVKEVMTPIDKLKVAYPDQDVLSILEQMDENNINQMPVVSGGRVIGLIARENLIRFLRTHSELRV